MKHLAIILVLALPLFAQTSPTPAAPVDKPLTQLPYTPSLDVPSMDKKADPCGDFYQYSCGGWIANNPIPADQAAWSVYGKVTDENQRYLWGDYFAACMDTSAVKDLGYKPLKPLLAEIQALSSKKQLAKFLAEEHPRSNSRRFVFGFGSDQDYSDATQVIAAASAGGLALPDRDYYLKDDAKSKDIREKYLAHVAKVFELTGVPKATAKKNAETVMRIERDLAGATLTRVERRNPYNLAHKMTVAEVEKLTPSFDWKTYLANSGAGDVKIINIDQPKFFQEVDKQLTTVPLPDWKTYLQWHAIDGRSAYLSPAFVTENFDFYSKALRGVQAQPPRWKRCVRYVDRDLGEALGQEFVNRTFTPQTKAKTVDMTRRIETAMENEVKNLDWMTDATKQRALEKLHSIANKVGYPDRWRDYSAVHVTPTDFFGNVSRAQRFEARRELAKIGKPVDRGEWGMTPPTVNAYYNPQMNDINFPAGVLQPPLYDPKLDDAPNYGNTGSTIGHELTHAFDDEGRQFDAQGNLKDWWTADDAKKFEERIQCVRDQYATYTIVDDIKINSKLTSGEDVADLGGTLLAYIAWKDATASEKLENMDGFTPDQRFFIGFAQWACESQRPENLRVNALTNPHSPGKYRINGIVSDLPEFAKAFGCNDGSPMTRGAKGCKVW